MTTLAVLAKYNTQRGVISWRFTKENNTYKAIRNDGRVFPYTSIDAMRHGYRHVRDTLGFTEIA